MDDTVVFSVPWFDILARKVNDCESPYYLLRTGDYVTILAATDEGTLLLVKQYRPTVQTETLELPSGHVEDGESPEASARRELAEETGYEAENFELLGTLAPDTGRLSNLLWCYYAGNAKKIQAWATQEHGLKLVPCSPVDLFRRIREGSINHALNLAVLMLAILRGKLVVE